MAHENLPFLSLSERRAAEDSSRASRPPPAAFHQDRSR
ncbi:hypothetical protein AZ78_3974 [Lysobacter capsici AZ78]|uniref:Uncharacterized protein n=1 Tax=Lysobacter capsici AZ78 TaxID=1444315 RepID=A0A108UC11_9GAMM|nr:hypothetical protein AZ78_3974 [Lysobacter capsici AZ78]